MWLHNYHTDLLARIYDAPLYRVVGKLEALLPLLVGGGVFAALEIGIGFSDPLRLIVLVLLAGPGALWCLYVTFHELRSIPQRIRHHKNTSDNCHEE